MSSTRSLSEQGRDLLSRAANGIQKNEILSKLAFPLSKKTKDAKMWTEEEDALLRQAVEKYGEDWVTVAQEVPGRNKLQCVQRWKKTLRPGLIKGTWKPEEDALLLQVMVEEMEGDWQAISRRIPGRNAKQCKERWTLNLNPSINHGPWSAEEDATLVQLHSEIGGKWSILAKRLTGRTEHAIKTRFLSLQRQAAKIRGWTVDEDRLILKTFMLAPNLDGSSNAIRDLNGRTKKQIMQRWNYLRETHVSIDDLATSSSNGGILLTDQDLKFLVPAPTMSGSRPQMPMSTSSSEDQSEERTKSLARHRGSSNPSQPFRHRDKKLEKSLGSSSSSTSRVAIGNDLISTAYGLDPLLYGHMSEIEQLGSSFGDPFTSAFASHHTANNNNSNNSTVEWNQQESWKSNSTSNSSSRTLVSNPHSFLQPQQQQHLAHKTSSNSFSMPPILPSEPNQGGGGGLPRNDSFASLAFEIDQLSRKRSPMAHDRKQPIVVSPNAAAAAAAAVRFSSSYHDRSSNPYHNNIPQQPPGANHHDEMFRAFSNLAPEISGTNPYQPDSIFVGQPSSTSANNPVVLYADPHNHNRASFADLLPPPSNSFSSSPHPFTCGDDDNLIGGGGANGSSSNNNANNNSRSLRKFASSFGGLDFESLESIFNTPMNGHHNYS